MTEISFKIPNSIRWRLDRRDPNYCKKLELAVENNVVSEIEICLNQMMSVLPTYGYGLFLLETAMKFELYNMYKVILAKFYLHECQNTMNFLVRLNEIDLVVELIKNQKKFDMTEKLSV